MISLAFLFFFLKQESPAQPMYYDFYLQKS